MAASKDKFCGNKGSKEELRTAMLSRIAKTNAHFRHQQLGEDDLSYEEKFNIASDLLDKSTSLFLSRFYNYMEIEDTDFFSDQSCEYEVKYYTDLIKKEKQKRFCATRVKNRRYDAMKKLLSDGEYFSDDMMKHRDPYLYYQMVGQYQTEEEAAEIVDKSDLRFSTILMSHMDMVEDNYRFNLSKEKEEGQMEEEDSDEEELMDEKNENDESNMQTISEEKRKELKEEFQTIMQQRFLTGRDGNFDYSTVDENADYDDLDMLEKDEEEKYFDADDSDECDKEIPVLSQKTTDMCIEEEK